jgi:hypothetical protein
MHGFRREAGVRKFMRVRERLFAHALAFHKYQGLQEQVVLPGLALYVIHHVSELYVSVEAKNRHRKSKKSRPDNCVCGRDPTVRKLPFKNH